MAQPADDPYALSPNSIQEPPATLRLALRKIGPGLILAGSIVGTGELIATTNTGAKAGFALLWLVVVSCFIKVFIQVELGRYAVSSGETTLGTFRRLPGPGMVLVWWWLIMLVVTQTQMGAMVGSIGQAFHMASPSVSTSLIRWLGDLHEGMGQYLRERPELPWAVLTALATSLLLATGSYRMVEWGTTSLVVVFTVMTVGCVVLLPATDHPLHWAQIASGFRFQIPQAAVMSAFAMFGITGVGASELIAYPYWCIEKGYARNTGPRDESEAWARRARGWMRVMFADAWVSMVVYTLATVAFYFLGAAVLHKATGGRDLPEKELISFLGRMYEPVMGARGAFWFIVAGAFAVLYSTLFSATAANSRALADFLRVNGLVHFPEHGARLRWIRAFCVGFPIFDLIVYIVMEKPGMMVRIGGLIQAVTLPMIATAAVFLRYRRTDRRITSGPLWDFLLWLSMLGLYGAALYGIRDSLSQLFPRLF